MTKFEYREAQKLEKLNGKNDLNKLNGLAEPHPPFTEVTVTEIFLNPSLVIPRHYLGRVDDTELTAGPGVVLAGAAGLWLYLGAWTLWTLFSLRSGAPEIE